MRHLFKHSAHLLQVARATYTQQSEDLRRLTPLSSANSKMMDALRAWLIPNDCSDLSKRLDSVKSTVSAGPCPTNHHRAVHELLPRFPKSALRSASKRTAFFPRPHSTPESRVVS